MKVALQTKAAPISALLLLVAVPALAQTRLRPNAAPADHCAPIGHAANGMTTFQVSRENHTGWAPGLVLCSGGIGETGILVVLGGIHSASRTGLFARNPFITLTSNLKRLPELGKTVLSKGALDARFELA